MIACQIHSVWGYVVINVVLCHKPKSTLTSSCCISMCSVSSKHRLFTLEELSVTIMKSFRLRLLAGALIIKLLHIHKGTQTLKDRQASLFTIAILFLFVCFSELSVSGPSSCGVSFWTASTVNRKAIALSFKSTQNLQLVLLCHLCFDCTACLVYWLQASPKAFWEIWQWEIKPYRLYLLHSQLCFSYTHTHTVSLLQYKALTYCLAFSMLFEGNGRQWTHKHTHTQCWWNVFNSQLQ